MATKGAGMLRVLDLFSGIGGFSLGLERTGGFKTVAFCEIDPYCQQVLAKHWPNVPIYNDVRTLKYDGPVDVICGGYPCQPFSVAGKRQGETDDRHLWPQMFRLVQECRPTWVIGENVAGHITMGLDDVLSDLEGAGYACRAFVIPACAVDAKHRRDRVWIVANARERRRGEPEEWQGQQSGRAEAVSAGLAADAYHKRELQPERGEQKEWGRIGVRSQEDMAHSGCRDGEGTWREECGSPFPTRWKPEPSVGQLADGISGRLDGGRLGETDVPQGRTHAGRDVGHCWLQEPDIPRVAAGVKDRVHRLRALGNAVVPQVVEMIGRAILTANGGEDEI